MVALSNSILLYRAFSTLVGLFARVRLNTNFGKTVVMVFHLCQVMGMQPEVAYGKGMTGARTSYRVSQHVWVQCTECG